MRFLGYDAFSKYLAWQALPKTQRDAENACTNWMWQLSFNPLINWQINRFQICKKKFYNTSFWRHMSVTHADEGKLVHGCLICDRKFSHLFLLKNHEQSHLPYQQRQFTCKKCLDGKRFPTLNRLKAHEKQVRPNDVTLFSLDFVLLSSFKMSDTVFSCCFQFLTGNKKTPTTYIVVVWIHHWIASKQ